MKRYFLEALPACRTGAAGPVIYLWCIDALKLFQVPALVGQAVSDRAPLRYGLLQHTYDGLVQPRRFVSVYGIRPARRMQICEVFTATIVVPIT
jgi:hypothetical protein